MDTNTGSFLYTASALETIYHQVNKDDGFIDLGLSLKTLHPQACHDIIPVSQSLQSDTMFVPSEYHGLPDWPYIPRVNLNGSNLGSSSRTNPEECGDDSEAVQSKQRLSYIKVNMDGVVVGRKICPGDHSCYSNLAVQLEEMFGRLSTSGLRLFTEFSEFVLFYKDKQEHLRLVGDVPWKEFVESVKRLRIVPKSRVSSIFNS